MNATGHVFHTQKNYPNQKHDSNSAFEEKISKITVLFVAKVEISPTKHHALLPAGGSQGYKRQDKLAHIEVRHSDPHTRCIYRD